MSKEKDALRQSIRDLAATLAMNSETLFLQIKHHGDRIGLEREEMPSVLKEIGAASKSFKNIAKRMR